jgi:ribonuclease HI
MWTMFFDRSISYEGVGVGCILVDPEQRKTPISYHLEFKCTNNTVECEALVQGLKRSFDLKVKCIRVFGDLEIIV